MSELVSYSFSDGIARLGLDNGKANALSPEVFEALNAALDRAEQDRAVVVISGKPGIFSGGYDLKVMTASPEAAKGLVSIGSSLSRRLLAHPYPVVAVCTGHAIAKGAFLLLSCDYRIGVQGPFKIGLNEVAIGMTMHHAGIELARARLTSSAFNRSVINAEMFSPEQAVEAGFLDRAVPAEELEAEAMAIASQLTQLNMTAHRKTKLKARKGLLELLDWAIDEDKHHNL
ncbi:crotonase/enoyl-CoA hydratase family protein [Halopseudomonas formosensis]|uniref:Crotonase/enoyl-CoA hydratase family protein n=1 Tax=Halopseudomonas formosensis TaxID=1002526 RepID=A0ABU5BZW8_9GAMM|nr:crotonase/enoyl-CoA hydratase family protein [Halopseudomonas formosensis]MDX9688312.1 crotonase/enoyl-CoA hydratase family protein [Halopseudomonas formosensis]